MYQMPPPHGQGHGFHINYKTYPGAGNCHYHTVPRWDNKSTPVWTANAGQMNGTSSQVGNLAMVYDNPLGEATYYAVANRPTFFGTALRPYSINNRAMVLYE